MSGQPSAWGAVGSPEAAREPGLDGGMETPEGTHGTLHFISAEVFLQARQGGPGPSRGRC